MLHIELLTPLLVPMLPMEEPAVVAQPIPFLSDYSPAQDHSVSFPPHAGWYTRVSTGLVTQDDDTSQGNNEEVEFNEGYLLSVALGMRVTSGQGPLGVDVEVEGFWSQQDADDTGQIQAVEEVTVIAGMLNVTADYSFSPQFAAYLGAGLGMAWMDVGTTGSFEDEDGPFFAWQARTGLEWRFTPSLAANFGYRFFNIDDTNIDDTNSANPSFELSTQQHMLELGLRFDI